MRAGRLSGRPLAVAGVVQRPALGDEALAPPLDILRSGQLVGELGDHHADVDVVEVASLHQFVGHQLDLVVAQPARQQGKHREVVSRRNAFWVAGAQPGDYRRKESVHNESTSPAGRSVSLKTE